MLSPLKLLVNAEIDVTIPGDQVTLNANTGNWEVVGTNTIFLCYLKAGTPNINYQIGIDTTQIYLTGYCVEPAFLPTTVKLPNKFTCRLVTPNGVVTGEIELKVKPTKAVLVDEILGQAIEGFFRSN